MKQKDKECPINVANTDSSSVSNSRKKQNMKIIFALTVLVAVSSAEWTCNDCNAVVTAMSNYLSSEDSLRRQVDILLAEVCPQVEQTEACVEGISNFWISISAVLWPGYFNPEADWMCAQLCSAGELK